MVVHYNFSFLFWFFAFLPVLVQPLILSTLKSEFGPLWAWDRCFFEITILSIISDSNAPSLKREH
jgi:hypothetical protein